MCASANIESTQPTPRGITSRALRPDFDSIAFDCPSSLPLTEAALAVILIKET